MKLNHLTALIPLAALLPLMPMATTSAAAVCAVVDVNAQIVMRGSETPSNQTNEVTIDDDQPCFGNASVNVNRQVGITSGEAEQRRTSHHQLGGGTPPIPGLSGKTIKVPVNVQIDQYNPALDQQYLSNFGWPTGSGF